MKCIPVGPKPPIIDVRQALEIVKKNGSLEFLDEGEAEDEESEDEDDDEDEGEFSSSIRGVPSALVLCIASMRGICLNEVDFVLGGGTLNIFGEKEILMIVLPWPLSSCTCSIVPSLVTSSNTFHILITVSFPPVTKIVYDSSNVLSRFGFVVPHTTPKS